MIRIEWNTYVTETHSVLVALDSLPAGVRASIEQNPGADKFTLMDSEADFALELYSHIATIEGTPTLETVTERELITIEEES